MTCLHLLLERKCVLDGAIYVDTGFSYPETRAMINYACERIPVHVVLSDRKGQNERLGIPADVVPVEWTDWGQILTTPKSVTIQSAFQCCHQNIGIPLLGKAKALGVTHLYYGQKMVDNPKGNARDGDVVDGIIRLHPIENWTDEQVRDYLAMKMPIPDHFSFQQSSLDCYDCTGFAHHSKDRIAWMQQRYPDRYAAYMVRREAITQSLQEAI